MALRASQAQTPKRHTKEVRSDETDEFEDEEIDEDDTDWEVIRMQNISTETPPTISNNALNRLFNPFANE